MLMKISNHMLLILAEVCALLNAFEYDMCLLHYLLCILDV